MPRAMIAFLAVVSFLVCGAVRHAAASPPSSPVPRQGPVPVGASLAAAQSLEVYLLNVTETHPVRAGLWAAGKGYARMEAGEYFFWNSSTPPRMEVEVPEGPCADLLKRGAPDGRAIRILGTGDSETLNPSAGVYVGRFKLSNVASCESVTKK